MSTVDVKGDIVCNDDKWIYEWMGWDATSPRDIEHALKEKPPDEKLKVLINSGGGSVTAGQEIYSLLFGRPDVEIEIQSLAGSAAGVIAMGNKCRISPLAMLMIHNVSMHGASGDYHDMKKNAEILKQMNAALANAFVVKTGKTEKEILELMDRETWITANQALEMGFVDEIIKDQQVLTNAFGGMRLTDEIRKRVISEKAQKEQQEQKEQEAKKILDDIDFNYGV